MIASVASRKTRRRLHGKVFERIKESKCRNSHQEVSFKKGVLFCWVSILWTLVYLLWTNSYSHSRLLFFYQVILRKIKRGSFSQEFRYSGTRNNLRTGTLLRIFKYSTEHLDSPSHFKYLSLSSLRIKKEHLHFPRKQANTTKEHLSFPENT